MEASKRAPSEASEMIASIDEDDTEATKLKGLVWPGMDIFDAATEEMRRKRNQKKDGSLLKQMEKTSALIEAKEIIYSPSGIERKQRPITGNIEEDSPLKGETPVPKKRTVRAKRTALAPLSTNTSTRRPLTRSAAQYANSLQVSTGYLAGSEFDPYSLNAHYSPSKDDREEFNLTFGLPGNSISRPLTVYNDDNEDPRTPSQASNASVLYDHHYYGRAESYLTNFPPPSSLQAYQQPNPFSWPQQNNMVLESTIPGKENLNPAFLASTAETAVQHNPLGWTRSTLHHPITQASGAIPSGWLRGLQGEAAGFASNPLNAGFQRMHDEIDDPLAIFGRAYEAASTSKRCIMSPASTISSPDIPDLPKGYFTGPES